MARDRDKEFADAVQKRRDKKPQAVRLATILWRMRDLASTPPARERIEGVAAMVDGWANDGGPSDIDMDEALMAVQIAVGALEVK